MSENVSRIPISFNVENFGESKGELIRYLAPRTIEALLRTMPIDGIITTIKGMLYFGVPVKLGVEKSKPKLEKGAIAYWPMGSAVCIALDTVNPYSPVNIIGKITENLEILNKITSGKRVRMYQK